MLQVHVLNVSACFPNGPTGDILKPHTSLQPLLGLVDEATRRDVEKFRFLRDARCCMLGRLLARYVLWMRLDLPWQSFSFEKSENGRPYAVHPSFSDSSSSPQVDYNVSHDSDYVVVASLLSDTGGNARRVGVDVMRIRNPWDGATVDEFVEGISEQLTPSEIQALHSRADQPQRLHYALALWTLKEAYIKATGDGLHFDLQRLDFHLPNLDETSEFTTAGFARLDGAPLRGRRFQLVQLVSEVAREPYWLALAEQAADGQGEVDVVRGARPDCVREVSLGEMLDVAG